MSILRHNYFLLKVRYTVVFENNSSSDLKEVRRAFCFLLSLFGNPFLVSD
jgi:hypothetical protein